MSRLVKFLALCAFFAVFAVVWLCIPAPGVPILAYHMVNDQEEAYSIAPAQFAAQIAYLAERGYTAISLQEYFMARDGLGQLPDKPVIITFDDGYADNYLTALPILERHGMKATVFVISEAVGQPGYLTWEQIREMQARNTEIGSHTASHVALREVDDREKRRQLQESAKVLQQNLQTPVQFLAYPFGSFEPGVFRVLQETGYRGACTGKPGINRLDQAVYALKRINVPRPKYGLWEFKIRLLRANIYSRLGI